MVRPYIFENFGKRIQTAQELSEEELKQVIGGSKGCCRIILKIKKSLPIFLAIVAIIAGSVSCQKVNDIDKRLTELEQTVSDLKAQILAGAVITSVDKTDDGYTIVLSNGQTYYSH